MPVRAGASGTLAFEKFLSASASADSKSFTIRATSEPAWQAVLALPALEEKCLENEASDSIFFRYYANAIAEKIANSDPQIRANFERWRNAPEMKSPLENDAAIKRIALEETPFARDARGETERRRAIAKFFDTNRIATEKTRALDELRKRLGACRENGWNWFPGRENVNDFVTLNILTGFARLREREIETDISLPMRAVSAQDKWLGARFDRFDENGKYVPGSLDSALAAYLYMRAFYAKEVPQSRADAWEHYLAQAKDPRNWLALPRMSQAHIALALYRTGGEENIAVAKRIAESIREHATRTDELGVFWKDERALPWWRWDYSPIETQAMMIELFENVAGDENFAEEIRINLLAHKQANSWGNSRATADAIWAVLGAKSGTAPLKIKCESAGAPALELENVGKSTSEKTFVGNAVVPALGKISVENPNSDGVAWVSAHWTFSQDISDVSEHGQNAMKIRKTLWKKSVRPDGTSALFPARGEILEPGDELVARLTIETDRDFEFVHMKDYRGSGTEPANVLSGWKRKNAVWYYETPRDTATHFFFEKLPAGTHVFEYSLRVQQRGKYTGGITELRSLYAPEFNAHSAATSISTR